MNPRINYKNLYCGTLCQIRRPGGKTFYHLTWKEGNHTVTRYIRLEEAAQIKEGIENFKKAKADLQRIAVSNLSRLMKGRGNGH